MAARLRLSSRKNGLVEFLESRVLLSHGYTIYVDPAGSDSSSTGNQTNPFATIAKAVGFATSGDTIDVNDGTYYSPTSGSKTATFAADSVTLQATNGSSAHVIIRGASKLTSTWTLDSGSIYKYTGTYTYFAPHDDGQGDTASSLPRNQIFAGSTYMNEVAAKTSMTAGTFFIDSSQVLYVWMPDSGNPSSETVVGTDTSSILTTNGHAHITIQNMSFQDCANPAQSGLLDMSNGSFNTMTNVTISYGAAAGLHMHGESNDLVQNSTFTNNGQEGIGSGELTNSSIVGVTCSWNNKFADKHFSEGWEAGGNKFTGSNGLVINGMISFDNAGPGIWGDVGNQNMTVENCTSHDNEVGLQYEISWTGTIINNTMYNNYVLGTQTSSTGIGIYISSSMGCVVSNNTTYENGTYGIKDNVSIRDDGLGHYDVGTANVFCNNIIAYNQQYAGLAYSYDIGHNSDNSTTTSYGEDLAMGPLPTLGTAFAAPLVTPAYNISDYNLFYVSTGLGWVDGRGTDRPSTLAGWQADSGQDMHSVWGDPFVNAAGGNFALKSGGPGFGAGVDSFTTPAFRNDGTNVKTTVLTQVASTDAVGTARWPGSWDIGAIQTTTPGVPSPWTTALIGSPSNGNADYHAQGSGSRFYISGSGSDINFNSDQFTYVYQPIGTNSTLVTRVDSMDDNRDGSSIETFAKAGLMYRASTAANAAFVDLYLTPANGVRFQYRASAGATASSSTSVSFSGPVYLKLVKSSSSVTGYYSSDGVTWTSVGSVALGSGGVTDTLNDAGLAVCAHNNAKLTDARFSNIYFGTNTSYTVVAPGAVPTGLVGLGQYNNGNPSTAINLAWIDNSAIETTDVIEYSTDGGTTWHTVASANMTPVPGVDSTTCRVTGLTPGNTYEFRIHASNAGGNSPASAIVSVVI